MSEKITLIYVSAEGNGIGGNQGNNNKFYTVELTDSGIKTHYGRVGTSGTHGSKPGGLSQFKSLVRAKERKGYVQLDLDESSESDEISATDGDVMMIALSQINSDDFSKKLIEKLVKKNIHNITTSTKITFNKSTGLFQTPLGVVSKTAIEKAIKILDKLSTKVGENGINSRVKEDTVKNLSEQYYSIIPTTISNLRALHNHLINTSKLSDQYDICDALLQTLDIVESQKKSKINEVKKDTNVPKLFDTSLYKLEDKKEFKRICKYFEDSKNQSHGRSTSGSKIVNIFKINIGKDDKAFRDDLSNQMELWHGTKVVNILSIMKSGLLMPKYSPGSVTGYMYGQGLYFANQSSKSLNYCDGMYWNSSGRSDNKIYMFVADIAMGNYQVPTSSRSKKPDAGFDSYWAKSGNSGVRNDEMIVFENNQIKLKYLLEIEI